MNRIENLEKIARNLDERVKLLHKLLKEQQTVIKEFIRKDLVNGKKN